MHQLETPNLNYINQLANGDVAIFNKLITIIKEEFPEEKNDYFKSLANRNFKEIESNVHRIKHKISILGLEKSYEIANNYEHNLREKSLKLQEEFESILTTITNFIFTL